MKKLLVTGSSGLIGSEVCEFFAQRGWLVHGIDNNMRASFFGPTGDTRWIQRRLEQKYPHFIHHEVDIRNRSAIFETISAIKPDAIVHTAAQPSHDKAASIALDDFDINAGGTLNLLEGLRLFSTEIPFIHMSTNKVYGDSPNLLKMKEEHFRWDYDDKEFSNGISENFSIDQSLHSLFGASKVAADILVQEYGKYFGMPTCCLRGGCLTGPNHSGVELHGFLNYLIKSNVEQREYIVYGYKGKQVRDNIHSYDVANFCYAFIKNPRKGEVYNIGGGKENTVSVLEAFARIEKISGIPMRFKYVEQNRLGDHICYYSDLSKIKSHYPEWEVTKSLDDIFYEIYSSVTINSHSERVPYIENI
ncbi:NAD-dependent epimerase/dehydratase family protein [Desertivirga arenae]|uniref:NAD-dependent epimerase/dehydratase family protein n=1 Tax=Desertivirga arenae TaxID=2810309 RepID=UPI001A957802|nr:NAD-dependent epimerase/dehydratase family protein [Pedobacter sp. SYSU D00823]